MKHQPCTRPPDSHQITRPAASQCGRVVDLELQHGGELAQLLHQAHGDHDGPGGEEGEEEGDGGGAEVGEEDGGQAGGAHQGARATILGSVVWCGVAWLSVVWCGVAWHSVVWCGVGLCGVMLFSGAPEEERRHSTELCEAAGHHLPLPALQPQVLPPRPHLGGIL